MQPGESTSGFSAKDELEIENVPAPKHGLGDTGGMPEDLEDWPDQGMGDVSLDQPGFLVVCTDGLMVLAEAGKC